MEFGQETKWESKQLATQKTKGSALVDPAFSKLAHVMIVKLALLASTLAAVAFSIVLQHIV
jgi:hypothetical protein